MCTYNVVRGTLNKCKNKHITKSPVTVAGVEAAYNRPVTMRKYGTSHGVPWLPFYRGTVIAESYAFTVFASDVVVQTLAGRSGKRYQIDGTFGCLPNGEYKQLLVIHLEVENHVNRDQT